MRNLAIIGLAVATVLAGCASTSGAESEPMTGAATAPDPGDRGASGMMASMCPMKVPGTTVAATEVEGGIGLAFTTTTGDVAELRQRVRRMAEMHNKPGGEMMMDGRMKMPTATASVEDGEGGAQLVLKPKDPAQLGTLREHVRMKAQEMDDGECPMMPVGSGSEPAQVTHRVGTGMTDPGMGSVPHGLTAPERVDGAR